MRLLYRGLAFQHGILSHEKNKAADLLVRGGSAGMTFSGRVECVLSAAVRFRTVSFREGTNRSFERPILFL
jgi:hypothetical protein